MADTAEFDFDDDIALFRIAAGKTVWRKRRSGLLSGIAVRLDHEDAP
jgi:hypothetical protein